MIGGMTDDFVEEWEAWRLAREARLTSPHGFLAVTGLHWLTDEPQRFDGAPGEWSTTPEGVVVDLADGEELVLDGEARTGRQLLGPVDEGGVRASYGDTEVEVASRGTAVMVRPRRPDNPLRATHVPTPTYPPSRGWVLPAAFEPYDEPRPLAVDTVIDGWTDIEDAVGDVVFTVDGETHRLVALGDSDDLWILFADATSGRTTYGAGRQLSAEVGPDGTVVLDFNRAINLPCAYTSFATCPLPPAGNRLPVPVEAGEMLPA